MHDPKTDRRPARAPSPLARFWRARRGAIAPLFALMAVPLTLAIGTGVDISRTVSSRSNLQDALDATGLAMAHLPSSTPTSTLQTFATTWMNANLHDSNLGPVTLTVTPSTQAVNLTATSSVNTTFAAVVGVKSIALSAASTVKWGLNHIELALVLDNTGSMNDDNKLSSLKTAASSLVDTLSASATASGDPNALKIGVVPFSMTVNVGSTYQNASWITGTSPAVYNDVMSPVQNRFTLLSNLKQSWGGCVEDRPMPYDVQDTAPTTSNASTMFVPFFAPDEPDTGTYSYSGKNRTIYGNYVSGASYYSVNSYIADGSVGGTNYALTQSDPTKYNGHPAMTGASNSYWGDTAGPNSGCQIASLQRLTTDMSQVRAKLTQMIAAGDTEIPVGLVWGWHVLSPNAPFADGAAYGTPNTIKIAVLVTDGQNTYGAANNPNGSFYTALGYAAQKRISSTGTATGTATALNTRLAQLCTNMQAAGVIIYTVPVEVTDTGIKSLLQNCASSADNYIDVSSSSQLQAAFNNIAGSISKIRIAQ